MRLRGAVEMHGPVMSLAAGADIADRTGRVVLWMVEIIDVATGDEHLEELGGGEGISRGRIS